MEHTKKTQMLALEDGEEEEALTVEVVHPDIAAIFPQSLTADAKGWSRLAPGQSLAVPALQLPSAEEDLNARDEWECTLPVRPTSQALQGSSL